LSPHQELIQFPRPKLPESIQKQLASSISQNAAGLSGSTPNPSLTAEATSIDDSQHDPEYPTGQATRERMKQRALAMASANSGTSKKRIPVEHRWVPLHVVLFECMTIDALTLVQILCRSPEYQELAARGTGLQ
jgi:hypothetical protein